MQIAHRGTTSPNQIVMSTPRLEITYVGGPTALLRFGAVRLLTDPTFDPGGGEYKSGPVTLRKLRGPALGPGDIHFDYVLLSHDHHFDNLDNSGRRALSSAKTVVTTEEGADRLGGNSVGLKDWESLELTSSDGKVLCVTATPARHGPEGLNRGAVNGFVAFFQDAPEGAIYFSGDTVWYPGVAEVAGRFHIQVAILNLGAARVPEVGPFHLTMTAEEAVEASRAFEHSVIVPLHFEDWAHFSEGRDEIARAFHKERREDQVRWLERGRAIEVSSPLIRKDRE